MLFRSAVPLSRKAQDRPHVEFGINFLPWRAASQLGAETGTRSAKGIAVRRAAFKGRTCSLRNAKLHHIAVSKTSVWQRNASSTPWVLESLHFFLT